jgi:hypothetical protein
VDQPLVLELQLEQQLGCFRRKCILLELHRMHRYRKPKPTS